jgi:hypothetical protein
MADAYAAFGEEIGKVGVMKSSEGLQPTSTATTVRVREGKTLTTDGPFAETREQLGGVWFFDCEDLDEAISLVSAAGRHRCSACAESDA